MRAILLIAMLSGVTLLTASCGKMGGDAATLVGNPAPVVNLSTLDGGTFTTADYSGKVLLLDFWATWCPPCRESLPHVQQLSIDAVLAAKGLVVQTIDDQETADVVQKFQSDNNYTFHVAIDPDGSALSKYQVTGIPTTVLIGRDGSIRNVWVGYDPGMPSQIKDAVAAALGQ